MDEPVKLCIACAKFAERECTDERNQKPNLVRGGIFYRLYPADLRDMTDKCGPSGAWWTPKEAA